jgi:acetyltransferase-like isoleucine patch superfamily enzyme
MLRRMHDPQQALSRLLKAVTPGRARGFLKWLPYRIGYVSGPKLMSWLRKQWVLLRHPHATIRFGDGTYLGPGFSLDMPRGGTFITGTGVEFRRDFRAELAAPDSRIEFGAGAVCTYSVLMQCTTSIEIGKRCQFGQATIVVDGNHRFRDLDRPMLEQGYDFTPIHIEDDATVTTKCTIMADIGKRAFIGANAVVSKPIPAYTLAVGIPARPIEYFGPPGSEPEELKTPSGSGLRA